MNLMPVGVLGLVVAALLAVVMSTASSYLNSTAVVLTKDIYQPLSSPRLAARRADASNAPPAWSWAPPRRSSR